MATKQPDVATPSDDSVSVTNVPVNSHGTVTVLRTENHRLSEILEQLHRSLGGDGQLAQIAETNKETLARLVDVVDQLAAERERPAPAALPVLRQPTESTLAEPADLPDCRIVPAPPLSTLFDHVYAARARGELGLTFPPDQAWCHKWVDAPQFRKQDGLTIRRRDGYITVFLNLNAPSASFAWNIYHELKHVSDYFLYGDTLSNAEMERRAEAFARRALAPPPAPKPEPVSLGGGYRAGNHRRYYA